MANVRPSLLRAPDEYSKEMENLFRRELEIILSIAIQVAGAVASGDSSIMSSTIKRQAYMPPVGIMFYG
jgi:hypothetical protein